MAPFALAWRGQSFLSRKVVCYIRYTSRFCDGSTLPKLLKRYWNFDTIGSLRSV